jgi:hypothetical protein
MTAYADVSFFPREAKPLTRYRKYWAHRLGTAPFLPMSRQEMQQLGWDSCDIIIVTGDAYVDHPSFGMASWPNPTGIRPILFRHWAGPISFLV